MLGDGEMTIHVGIDCKEAACDGDVTPSIVTSNLETPSVNLRPTCCNRAFQ